MKTNMTERDKNLLVFMFIVVIVVGIGYWGVIPQIKAYNDYSSKLEDEESLKKVNQMKIVNASMIDMQADDYEADIAKRKDEFYQLKTSSEIDRMMTEMASSRGLNIYDLQFAMPNAPSDRMAYQYSDLYKLQLNQKAAYEKEEDDDSDEISTDLTSTTGSNSSSLLAKKPKETTADINDQLLGDEDGYQPNTDIYAVPVTITVGGNISDLSGFLNDILGLDKRVLLVGYSWGDYRQILNYDSAGNVISSSDTDTSEGEGVTADELEDEVMVTETKKSLTVKLEIYMCDTTDVADDAAEEDVTDSATDE